LKYKHQIFIKKGWLHKYIFGWVYREQFRGREMAHIDRGKELMIKVILAVEEFGMAESMPSMEGKKMFATIKPKSK
jgi:translation initiation factor IF-3